MMEVKRHSLPRSIPAPAGEPISGVQAVVGVAVYPRACGGTDDTEMPLANLVGLSPRLRGNLVGATLNQIKRRSIPAPAGEPIDHAHGL